MTVKALMPVRNVNLVAPLGHKPTDMHTTDTAAPACGTSGAAASLIGASLRQDGLHSATTPRGRGTATSTTATRTTTTGVPSCPRLPSADSNLLAQLVQAWLDCRRTKRNSASALAFEAHAERNLIDLRDELAACTYQPGRSICFVVTRPRPREVWAAGFPDRVVHHLLYNRISQRFHARFTADSCACIPGRGTLYAAKRLEHQVRSVTANWSRPASYLKCDLANFFVSIDKAVVLRQLLEHVAEPWWAWLTETVLMHDPRPGVILQARPDEMARVPAHKRLLGAPATHGLPIGNLSSQFFANVLLNDLDQHVKHRIRAPHYVRYVDDFVLVHESADWLNEVHASIEAKLAEMHLKLNPRKTILQPVARGVDFVGHVIKPWRRTTRPRTLATALQRIETLPAADLHAAGNSYFGLVRQAGASHQEQAAIARAMLKRGHAVDGAFTKAFRRKEPSHG